MVGVSSRDHLNGLWTGAQSSTQAHRNANTVTHHPTKGKRGHPSTPASASSLCRFLVMVAENMSVWRLAAGGMAPKMTSRSGAMEASSSRSASSMTTYLPRNHGVIHNHTQPRFASHAPLQHSHTATPTATQLHSTSSKELRTVRDEASTAKRRTTDGQPADQAWRPRCAVLRQARAPAV